MSCIALLIAPSTTKNVVIICSKYSVTSWCMDATPIFRNDLLQEYAGRERVDHFVDFEKENPPICYYRSHLLSNLSSSQIKIKFGLFVSEKWVQGSDYFYTQYQLNLGDFNSKMQSIRNRQITAENPTMLRQLETGKIKSEIQQKILKIRKEWGWRLQLRSYSSNPSDNCDTNLAWHLPATIAVYGPFPRFKWEFWKVHPPTKLIVNEFMNQFRLVYFNLFKCRSQNHS